MNSAGRMLMVEVVAVCFALPAVAEETSDLPRLEKADTGWKIRPRLWCQLGALPLYFLGHNVVHEGSHSIAAAAQGGKVVGFAPYPHMLSLGDGQTRFVFASMSFTGNLNANQRNWVSAAPSIADLSLFLATDLTLSYVDPDSWYAPVLFMIGMFCPLIDWITAMNALSPQSDISLFSANNGLNRVGMLVAGDVIATVGLWRILHHGQRLFIEAKYAEAGKPTLSVNPLLGSGAVGLSLTGTF